MSDDLEKAKPKHGGRKGLLPDRHRNRDFFIADLVDYAMKDDGASMEAPIFSLSTKPDLTQWEWKSKDGDRVVTVTPSVLGRATQFDKDVLIYLVSQMTEALNRGRGDAGNRTVRFTVYDYLVATNKPTGGNQYQRLETALDRLLGTTIKTNIKTGGVRIKEAFGIIDRWRIVEKSSTDERMIAVEVVFSEWLNNAVQKHEVLTINKDYFRLRKPLERRIYELARKHAGYQYSWIISMALLYEKSGSQAGLKEFKRMLKDIAEADTIPDYKIVIDGERVLVVPRPVAPGSSYHPPMR